MKTVQIFIIAIALAVSGCAKYRGHKPDADQKGVVAATEQKKTLSPEEMQKAWDQASKPGEAHGVLKPLVGKWNATVKCWLDPTKPPEVTKGSSESVWVLDGRFIQEKHLGKMMGKPFKGQGILGYDNAQGRYVSSWIDTMATGIFRQEGKYDPTNNSLEFFGAYKDPATGEIRKTRSVTRIASNDSHVFEMYELDDSGREFKNLEITYTRKK